MILVAIFHLLPFISCSRVLYERLVSLVAYSLHCECSSLNCSKHGQNRHSVTADSHQFSLRISRANQDLQLGTASSARRVYQVLDQLVRRSTVFLTWHLLTLAPAAATHTPNWGSMLAETLPQLVTYSEIRPSQDGQPSMETAITGSTPILQSTIPASRWLQTWLSAAQPPMQTSLRPMRHSRQSIRSRTRFMTLRRT